MREILFRGKTYRGEWVEGNFIDWGNHVQVYIFPLLNYATSYDLGTSINVHAKAVIPETVGEFTGLYNGAGQKIFEDDIVRFEGNLYRVRREDETPGGVWSSTAYILQQIGWNCLMSFEDTIDEYSNEICVEIVGNIHDNPELLKWERKENES